LARPLIAEIQKEPLPSGYPAYLREKIKKLAALWDENVKSSSPAQKEPDQSPSRETIQ
jgi:tetrahydromethanopterin S-methyltransferase subunit B